MKHDYEYSYARIKLLPLERTDIEQLRILRNQQRQYFLSKANISEENQKKWYESYLEKSDDIMFKIVKLENPSVFIGAIAVYNINNKSGYAEFGRVMVDKNLAPEKGIGTEATKAVCKFSFEVLGLKRLTAEVLKTNERAIKAYQKAGFYITGDGDENVVSVEVTRETLTV